MPTGYTAQLMEKGQDFRSFVLTCARARGACIMQRDDPLSNIPEKQEPSDYHTKIIKDAQELLARLKAMTAEQARTHGLDMRQKAIESAQESLARNRAEEARLDEMAVQVGAWTPPTNEHLEFKSFMLDQLQISRNSDYAQRRLKEAEDKPPEAYFVEAISSAVRDMSYHAKEYEKEVERTKQRNEWIDKLYKSLPSNPNAT